LTQLIPKFQKMKVTSELKKEAKKKTKKKIKPQKLTKEKIINLLNREIRKVRNPIKDKTPHKVACQHCGKDWLFIDAVTRETMHSKGRKKDYYGKIILPDGGHRDNDGKTTGALTWGGDPPMHKNAQGSFCTGNSMNAEVYNKYGYSLWDMSSNTADFRDRKVSIALLTKLKNEIKDGFYG